MFSTPAADLAPRLTAARETLLGLAQELPRIGSDDLADLAALTAGVAAAAQAAQAAVVLEADQRGVIGSSDNPRVADWVAQSCRDADAPVTPAVGRALGRISQVCRGYHLTRLRDAITTGRVPVDAAEHAAVTYQRLQRRCEVPFWDLILDGLIGWAGDGANRRDLSTFEDAITGQYATATELHDRQRRHRDRELTTFTTRPDGTRTARLTLDEDSETLFTAAITALSAPRPEPDGSHDHRTPGTRRADALLSLARLATRPDKDTPGTGAKARITITIALTDLLTGLHLHPGLALPGLTLPGLTDTPGITGTGDTGTGGLTGTAGLTGASGHAGCGITGLGQAISVAQVRMLACDAHIIPTVLGTKGEILDQGHGRRLATPALVAYLWQRDKGCTYPNCTMPPAFCDAHHLIHWLRHGPTNRDNLTLLCQLHHTTVHRFDHKGTVTPDGVHWCRNDGTPIGNHPRTPAGATAV